MASDTTNTERPPNPHGEEVDVAVQLHPELLMAAKRGNWRRLEDLMSNGGPLVPRIVVDVDIEAAADDERCRSDSVLHAVASGGDGDEFLRSSAVILNKAEHLLGARNAMGDTPLHCAARAGSIKMVSHLIDLARFGGGEDGASRVQVALRKENRQRETVLHEAIRRADVEMVGVLMEADAELARFPRANGASPLYLAILLGHDVIAELLHEKDNQLSYSGPDGQNALHVAVLRSERMTKKLLYWNKSLMKQGDRSSGRMPLHFAASSREPAVTSGTAKLLLDTDESSAYQSDDKGSFPIHVAAMGDNKKVVRVLLQMCPDCAQLRDAQGRTFIHIACEGGYRKILKFFLKGYWNPKDACQMQSFASFINMQDHKGNTALHFAAKSGSLTNVHRLISNKEVQLNLQNNEGKTALDVARMTRPPGLLFVLDPEVRILRILRAAGGRPGVPPCGGDEEAPAVDLDKEAEKIKDSTATIGIASVLIITISFAAAFQYPGGYSTGDKQAGTPELAKVYTFEAFIVANNLAALCSSISTFFVLFAGVTTVAVAIRKKAFLASIFFLNSSARSLAAAFAFGTHAVLVPVAPAATIFTWLLTGVVVLDIVCYSMVIGADKMALLKRKGIIVWLGVAYSTVYITLLVLWPYIVIAGFIACLKISGRH